MQALPQHLRHGVRGQVVDHAELEVGQWADRQGHALVRQPPDQAGVLHGAVAVVDAIDVQQVQRLMHIGRWPLLAGVGAQLQAHVPGAGEDALELGRRVADLGGVEADADDPVQPRLGRREGGEGGVLVEVAQEAQDQLRGDAQLRLGPGHAGQQAVGDDREGDAPVRVGLGIEEDLGVPDIVRRGAAEVGEGEVVEVLLRLQHGGPGVIDVEEVLQVGEGVGRAHRLDVREGDLDPVAPGEGEHLLRLQRALDVQVQLGLGQAGDEGVEIGHGGLLVRSACPRRRSPSRRLRPTPAPRSPARPRVRRG